MKRFICLFLLWTIGIGILSADVQDTLVLNLGDAIYLARQQSPEALSARNSYLVAYWNFRYYQANYLPSVILTSSPYINKEMNKITQSDGTDMFIRQDQFGADITLKVNQNISFTGGCLFLKSSLHRIDELQNKTKAYRSEPVIIGYEQSLFGYNSLKWDRRIEPLRFTEAKKRYAETLELIAASTCNHFFTLASAQTELELTRQNFASADTLFNMAKGRYSIGTISENEYLQLEVNRLNEETNMMEAEINLQEALQSMRSFLGLDEAVHLRLEIADSVPHFEVPPEKALDLALQNSPDPEAYRIMIKESESNLAYAKGNSGLKAELYLQFGLSQTGVDIGSSFNNLMHQEYASVSLSLPILDWGRARGKVKVAKSQLELSRTRAEQAMADFSQNLHKLVLQFNMQARRVSVASITDRRASQRYAVAKHLYIMGRSGILDLMSAVSEKNYAKRGFINTLRTYWTLYYTLRSLTAFDFENNLPITEILPI